VGRIEQAKPHQVPSSNVIATKRISHISLAAVHDRRNRSGERQVELPPARSHWIRDQSFAPKIVGVAKSFADIDRSES